MKSLGSFRAFDGLLFGFGFSVSFRFGRDADAPQAQVRDIRFGEVRMPDVFAAMQCYYQRVPFAEIGLANTERDALRDLKVFFYQAAYSDSPTPCARLDELIPGQTASVPLMAGYNAEAFEMEGSAPLTGEVIATYAYRGRPVEQRTSLTREVEELYSAVALAQTDLGLQYDDLEGFLVEVRKDIRRHALLDDQSAGRRHRGAWEIRAAGARFVLFGSPVRQHWRPAQATYGRLSRPDAVHRQRAERRGAAWEARPTPSP